MSYPHQPQQSFPPATVGEPPLWAPYYGAPFPVAVRRFFKKYATFSGRASRSEYWWWMLVSIGVGTILNILITAGTAGSASASASNGTAAMGPLAVFGTVLLVLWALATIVPSLALTVRRLHDVNQSGWMILLGLIPFVGGIILLVFTLMAPKPAGQRFDQPSGR